MFFFLRFERIAVTTVMHTSRLPHGENDKRITRYYYNIGTYDIIYLSIYNIIVT